MKTVLIVVVLAIVIFLWYYGGLGDLIKGDITPVVNSINSTNLTNNVNQSVKYILNGREVGQKSFEDFKKLLTLDKSRLPLTGRMAPEAGTDKFGSVTTWEATGPSGQTYEYSERVTETSVTKEITKIAD